MIEQEYSLVEELMKEFVRLEVRSDIVEYIKSHKQYQQACSLPNEMQRALLTSVLLSTLIKLNTEIPRRLRMCFMTPKTVREWLHIMHITVIPFIKHYESKF